MPARIPAQHWAVWVTVLVQGKNIYILNVTRRRMTIPVLKATAIGLAIDWRASEVLIEDQASGTQLIQLLRAEEPRGVPTPIPRWPEGDKRSRALGVAAMIEAGWVYLPSEATWLPDFLSEVLGFPNSRYDDQIDALSQLLDWIRLQDQVPQETLCGPVIFWTDDFGVHHNSEDEDYDQGRYQDNDLWAP